MTIENILTVLVCCVSLIFLQVLKYYVIKCHTLECKLKRLSHHSESLDLNILSNRKMSPTITAIGTPTIKANLPASSVILGSNVASNVPIINPSASKIAKAMSIFPRLSKVVKVMIAKIGMSINK